MVELEVAAGIQPQVTENNSHQVTEKYLSVLRTAGCRGHQGMTKNTNVWMQAISKLASAVSSEWCACKLACSHALQIQCKGCHAHAHRQSYSVQSG